MDLTWIDATLLTLLFGLGSMIVQSLTRHNAHGVREKQQAPCTKHDWIRIGSRGLVCQLCGKIPG